MDHGRLRALFAYKTHEKRRIAPRRTARLYAGAAALAAALAACATEDPAAPTSSSGGDGGSGGAMACEPGAKVPCYTGAVATENVGTCKGGERTCNAEGTAFGVCEGQVTPLPDDCATPEDEDCDGTPAPACPGAHIVSHVIGGASDDAGNAVALDKDSAMLFTGFFGGMKGMKSADFGGGALTSGGGRDLFVAKLDASGAHAWSKGFGNEADQEGAAIAVDALGNAFVTGSFDGALSLGAAGTLTSAGARDGFVMKLGPTGDVLWARSFGDAASAQQGTAIAVDGMGGVLLAGTFAGSMDLVAVKLTSAGARDVFVTKLDSATGVTLWVKQLGDVADQSASGLAVDAEGNAIVTGGFKGTLDFGFGPVVSAGGDDVFVAKLNPQGASVFARSYGDASDQAGKSVATDATGGILLGGSFKGSLKSASDPALMSAGEEDLFLLKLDAAGELQWAKSFGDPSSQILESISVDAAGVIALTGRFKGSLDLGNKPPIPSTEEYDIFVAKLDAMGAYIWGRAFGGAFDQIGRGVALASNGDVAVTGTFYGSVDFSGGDPKPSAGLSDLFLARLAP